MGDIVRFTKLTQRQVRESLVVLIHHALVHFTEPEEGVREPTFYQADPQSIMMRLRIGPIMRVTEEQYGKEVDQDVVFNERCSCSNHDGLGS